MYRMYLKVHIMYNAFFCMKSSVFHVKGVAEILFRCFGHPICSVCRTIGAECRTCVMNMLFGSLYMMTALSRIGIGTVACT